MSIVTLIQNMGGSWFGVAIDMLLCHTRECRNCDIDSLPPLLSMIKKAAYVPYSGYERQYHRDGLVIYSMHACSEHGCHSIDGTLILIKAASAYKYITKMS